MKKRLLILLTLVFTLFTLASCNIGNLGKPTGKPDVGEEDDFDFNNIENLCADYLKVDKKELKKVWLHKRSIDARNKNNRRTV